MAQQTTTVEDTLAYLVKDLTSQNKRSIEDEVSKSMNKKLKENETPEFKRTYNKKQFQHNQKVIDALVKAERHIKNDQKDKAIEKIKEGKSLIDKRLKLIKLADREDNGWEVANFYDSDILAEDTDDEKRINRSRRQAAASKKKKSERNKSYRN